MKAKPKAIVSFTGLYAILSNFCYSPFWWRGKLVSYAENAYQSEKSRFEHERRLILTAGSPREAKNLGQECVPRSDWDRVKDEVMLEVKRAKFQYNYKARQVLLSTKGFYLVHGNYHGDTYWGAVRSLDGKQWGGSNREGELLMKVRRELLRKIVPLV